MGALGIPFLAALEVDRPDIEFLLGRDVDQPQEQRRAQVPVGLAVFAAVAARADGVELDGFQLAEDVDAIEDAQPVRLPVGVSSSDSVLKVAMRMSAACAAPISRNDSNVMTRRGMVDLHRGIGKACVYYPWV